MSAEFKFEVDWRESCKRRRDTAAENLIHFISDGIEDPDNQDLSKAKVLDLLDNLLKAQEKVQFWNHNDRTSADWFAISRCQHRLQRNQYTKLSMIKEILRMFSDNSSRQALERQLEWCDHWKKEQLKGTWI